MKCRLGSKCYFSAAAETKSDLKGPAGFHTLTHSVITKLHYKHSHESLLASLNLTHLSLFLSHNADAAET